MFQIKPRVGVIVWLYNLHHVKQLRRYGMIYYTSKRMKYVVLYVDQIQADAVKTMIEKLNFVRKVELSHRGELNTEFGERLDQLAEQSEQAIPDVENYRKYKKRSNDDAHRSR
ncbi:YlbG family protein [Agrilactobacillus fermenti]|uniref:YlbG family protein n=1 Tax=Agrilactobacillus fermenti TaxID=2586909 RepID=UPI001E2B2EF8|nr:YlbG family protein [Agrilactobacillus fermenti]MCD2255264.1 YlbG family protein [Agrilactobacillus fermenti]